MEDVESMDIDKRTVKQLEELLAAKESVITALTSELESVKDAASNQSTLSCPTSTEYKQLQEEYVNRVKKFFDLIYSKLID